MTTINSGIMDAYSEHVGSSIDKKRYEISFGTNTRHLVGPLRDPAVRVNRMHIPYDYTTFNPTITPAKQCSFDKHCCNMPPTSYMTVHGRLKDCYDPLFDEKVGSRNSRVPTTSYSKKYTTSFVGLRDTEN